MAILVREICGTSNNDQVGTFVIICQAIVHARECRDPEVLRNGTVGPKPGQRNRQYQERLLLLQVVAKRKVSWARVATPQLLNSVVNVDDVMQKIGSHLRLRFERFDYDLNRVTICEGCNYCKRRP